MSVSDLIPEDFPIYREDYKEIKAPEFYLKSRILFCDNKWDVVKRDRATHIVIAENLMGL